MAEPPGGWAAGFGSIVHVGIVVPDLQKAMEFYWRTLCIGPWLGNTLESPPLDATYCGEACTFTARIATAEAWPVAIELIQPLEGKSSYHTFIETKGPGVHHVAMLVPNLDEALANFKEQGISVLQSMYGTGKDGAGRQEYLDTERQFGTILQLVESPIDSMAQWVYPE
jgi:methylmalonyl-CoA/ethylmalonyl-CoA epimerase